jgi:hypothetical protein
MSLWVRCTRSFLLWSPAQLDDFYAIVMMIVNNLRTFPLERKYQELKFSNSQIQNRILKRSGGMEFMQAIGFQIQSKEDQKYFIFQEDYFQELDGSLSWLRFCSPSPCPGPTLFLPPSLPPSLPSLPSFSLNERNQRNHRNLQTHERQSRSSRAMLPMCHPGHDLPISLSLSLVLIRVDSVSQRNHNHGRLLSWREICRNSYLCSIFLQRRQVVLSHLPFFIC